MKNSSKIISMKKNSLDQFLAKLAIFVSILMIVGGAIGMILVQKDLQMSQDIRQQASVADGKVNVTLSSTDLVINQPGKVNFYINTSGVQTDGVQLTFNVVGDLLTEPPVFTLNPSSPLQLAYSEIETTTDGYLVSIIAIPKQLGQPFSSTTNTNFGSLDFTPTNSGTLTLNFDVENSISTIHASNPPKDELTQIATSDFVVVNNETQPSPSPSASPEASPTVSPSPDASPLATPELAPSPTVEPGTGGQTVATCNESCSSNSDCDVNLRCYSGQCRLVTNVSSSTCSAPADKGLSFNCNEYCSDSNECASGLTCQNNSCRNPENVNSTTCSNLSVAQKTSAVKSCNESCSSNNDCDVNLRCYQGACRLATNPGSYSCTASTQKVISESVYSGSTKSKGTDVDSSSTGKDGQNTTVGKVIIDKDKDNDMQNNADTDKVYQDESINNEDETALDLVKSYFVENPKLPVMLIGIGLGLIVAILLLAFLKRKGDDKEPPVPPMTQMGGEKTSSNNSYEQNLQDKINTLKKESLQTQGNNINIPPVVTPPKMTPPTMTHQPIAQMKIPQNEPVKNTSGEVFSNQSKSSSMLEKLKNKDITPPSV